MATPADKLASSLEALQKLQEQGVVAIRSSALTRTNRERLTKNGFLQEVMKGWYISSRPDEAAAQSAAITSPSPCLITRRYLTFALACPTPVKAQPTRVYVYSH